VRSPSSPERSTAERRARGRLPPSDRAGAAGARRGARRGGEPEPSRARHWRRSSRRRPPARAGRGDREEPRSAIRGSSRRAEPSPHDGTLAGAATGRGPTRRLTVARASQSRVGGDAVERAGAHTGRRSCRARSRSRPARRPPGRRGRCRPLEAGGRRPRRRRGARRSARRRGNRERVARRDALAGPGLTVDAARGRQRPPAAACARVGARGDAGVRRRSSGAARRLPPSETRMSALRRADPVPWTRRGQPNRVLVPALPARARSAEREGFEPSTSGLPPVTP
jgi:hypothetical protein